MPKTLHFITWNLGGPTKANQLQLHAFAAHYPVAPKIIFCQESQHATPALVQALNQFYGTNTYHYHVESCNTSTTQNTLIYNSTFVTNVQFHLSANRYFGYYDVLLEGKAVRLFNCHLRKGYPGNLGELYEKNLKATLNNVRGVPLSIAAGDWNLLPNAMQRLIDPLAHGMVRIPDSGPTSISGAIDHIYVRGFQHQPLAEANQNYYGSEHGPLYNYMEHP